MVKKYIVELSADEKKQLLDLTRKGKISARKLKRAQILSWPTKARLMKTSAQGCMWVLLRWNEYENALCWRGWTQR
jgi:hypothetical protein